MGRLKAHLLLLAALILAACGGIDRPGQAPYEHVLIYCALGYNNLSGSLRSNFNQIQEGVLPGLASDRAIVAFCHNTAGSSYSTANPPCLVRLYRGSDGRPVADTLKIYTEISLSASKEALRTALEDIQELFPSHHYGMIFSSHGSGWIPAGYSDSSASTASLASAAAPQRRWPETKAIGNQYVSSGGRISIQWLDMADFADAIPMRMDYMILDACLSGSVEMAYALKDHCDYLVVSPTEILTYGMVYTTLSWDMLRGREADLLTYSREVYEFYNNKTGSDRSATVSLVDCSKVEALADVFAGIVAAHHDALSSSLIPSVQHYYYSSAPYKVFHDLRDLARAMGASAAELASLDAALDACVLYHAETPTFFDLSLDRCCGLSVYIPDAARPRLNASYKTLAWNAKVRMIE